MPESAVEGVEQKGEQTTKMEGAAEVADATDALKMCESAFVGLPRLEGLVPTPKKLGDKEKGQGKGKGKNKGHDKGAEPEAEGTEPEDDDEPPAKAAKGQGPELTEDEKLSRRLKLPSKCVKELQTWSSRLRDEALALQILKKRLLGSSNCVYTQTTTNDTTQNMFGCSSPASYFG